MKTKANKKAKSTKGKKTVKVIKVEHNGIVSYKVAPKQSHMTKKTKTILVCALCIVPVFLGLVVLAIMLISGGKK